MAHGVALKVILRRPRRRTRALTRAYDVRAGELT